jgi:hypothetical protein
MGYPGALAPYGVLQYGGKPSLAESIYQAELAQLTDPKTGRSPFNLEQDGENYQEAKLYVRAIMIALARHAILRAYNQGDPSKAWSYGLANLEKDYLIPLSPADTLAVRRARLVAKRMGSKGASYSAAVAALKELLGAAFVSFFASTDNTQTPEPTDVPAKMVGRSTSTVPKFCKLLEPVAIVGTPVTVEYENLIATMAEQDLAVGDQVVVEGESTKLDELVTVSAVAPANGSVPRTFTGTFAFPHNIDATVTTMDWPISMAHGRSVYVVVKAASAKDAKTRALIHALMPSITRGVTTWSILGDDTNVDQFTLDQSPLGTLALTTIAYTPST